MNHFARFMFGLVVVTCCVGQAGAKPFSASSSAVPYVLANAPGGGTVFLGVDGFGAFGLDAGANATDATYDPVGAIGPDVTTFESGVAIRIGAGGARDFLASGFFGTSGGLTNPTVTGTATSANSSFTFGGLSFDLNQTLSPLFAAFQRSGSLLTQTYDITNTTGSTIDFELIRYFDGDLRFDGSLIDGGGRLFIEGTEVLFEIDSATGASTDSTFIGITGEGGTIPATNRFEIDEFPFLRSDIIAGTTLDDLIEDSFGDVDLDDDGFVDAGSGYDITLSLRNTFSLAPGASDTYTTRTIFGSGAPEEVTFRPPLAPEPSTVILWALTLAAAYALYRRRKLIAV